MEVLTGDDLDKAYRLARQARWLNQSFITFEIEAKPQQRPFVHDVWLWEDITGRVIGKIYAKNDKPRDEVNPDLPPSPFEVTHYVIEADAISVINAYGRRRENEITRSTAVKRAIYLDNGVR